MDQRDVLSLEGFLPYRLSVLSNTVSSTIARLYAHRFGLSIPEWRVMAVLGEHPERSAEDIVRRTVMDKVAVSRAVSKLLEKGLVEREFSETDRRRSILELSAEGAAVYRQVVPLATTYTNALQAALDADERRQLDTLLAKLTSAAHRLEAEGLPDDADGPEGVDDGSIGSSAG